MKIKKSIFVILIVLFVFPLQTFAMTGTVIGVKDGDTIKVRTDEGDLNVRLYGVDTPETKKRNLPGQPYGRKATNFTNKLVRGQIVELELYKRDNRYNREVAVVYVDGRNLNEELVRTGLAWVYKKYCRANFCYDWLNLESFARQNKIGLWVDENPINPEIWRHSH